MDQKNNKVNKLEEKKTSNFIYDCIKKDLAVGGRCEGKKLHTRFPPEPNGHLHIGHAKAIYINFKIAEEFGGICNLRMDDTNPSKEDEDFVEGIKRDIRWLGFDWEDRFFRASDYFQKMYEFAKELVNKGLAYVCELTPEQVKKNRGDLSSPAKSPFRDRPKTKSLELLKRMKNGEFKPGEMTLRAKIDLASGNFNMRDPVLYRIMDKKHHIARKWHIYPTYDYAHPIEDALEDITHSFCSLEFEDHRPLYNWVLENIDKISKPKQIEFARLSLSHTVMSKRKLSQLVEKKVVDGWDDPRMPTISGLRRRGYTPASIRNFCKRIGISKVNSLVDHAFLEHCIREDLNMNAKRIMTVLEPIKLTITNYQKNKIEKFEIENNLNKPEDGFRTINFSKHLYIEKDDFMTNPEKRFFRLFPGNEVRLKSTYVVKCTGYKVKNAKIIEVFAEYDPESRGGKTKDGRKIKSTIHWVNAADSENIEVHIYEKLFKNKNPEEDRKNFIQDINKRSLIILKECKAENIIKTSKPEESFQFLRLGYFCRDKKNSTRKIGKIIFNKIVSLKDSYKKNKFV
ncbi:MAG: glutamine--tRNA ligase/YqeY domain fusion protein [Oscillospiraceae bacterium]|jgi:glutaminyl-tRNA synthetase|nr:glutamine--tRNA ligase/YqeY domain fusion protein [Oscillospiraceae bacterium]